MEPVSRLLTGSSIAHRGTATGAGLLIDHEKVEAMGLGEAMGGAARPVVYSQAENDA